MPRTGTSSIPKSSDLLWMCFQDTPMRMSLHLQNLPNPPLSSSNSTELNLVHIIVVSTRLDKKDKGSQNGGIMEKRSRRTFTEEFKKQMVELYKAGKTRAEIAREYDLTASALDRWIARISKSGSSREKDNRSEEENELIALRKEYQRVLLENEILKKAALIFAKK